MTSYALWLQVDLLFGGEVEEAAQVFRDLPKVEAVIPVAAATGHNVKAVEDWAVSHLPRGPALYPKVHPSQQLSTAIHAYVQSTDMHTSVNLGSASRRCHVLTSSRICKTIGVIYKVWERIAGYCERASRALLCGRDHSGEDLPAVPTGDPLLHHSGSLPSALQLPCRDASHDRKKHCAQQMTLRIPEGERLHGLQVQIMDFKERDMGKDLVSATVFVEQDSQKGIVIGRGGSALKQLGSAARADIEAFLGKPSLTSRKSHSCL